MKNVLERIEPEKIGLLSKQVKKCIESLMHERTTMNGFMAARHGKVFAECFWKPYGPELVHSNHSFGKSYTATAIGIALKEKKLSLDEKLVDIFEEEIKESGIEIPSFMKKITIYHVLTMTNGQKYHPPVTEEWVLDYFRTPIELEPGTHFMYNSSGSCLLGAIIKKKTGENLKEYLIPRLFNKIGIDAERFVWLKFPDGTDAEPGTFATTEDNLRLALLYMNGGKWNNEQIVDETFIKQALSVQIKNEYAPEQKDGKCGYGYQLWACSIPGVFRFDGGQGQYGIIWPEKELVVSLHEGALMPYGPQETLDVIYKELLLPMRDNPLEEDKTGYDELIKFENTLEIENDIANEIIPEVDLSRTYSCINKTIDPWMAIAPPGGSDLFAIFRDGKEIASMNQFSLDLSEEKCVFRLNKEVAFEAFMDGKLRLRETGNAFLKLRSYCATARYINGYTLEIRIHWMNSWAKTRIVFEWQQNKMKVTTYKLRLNEEANYLVGHDEAVRK